MSGRHILCKVSWRKGEKHAQKLFAFILFPAYSENRIKEVQQASKTRKESQYPQRPKLIQLSTNHDAKLLCKK